MAPGPTIFPAPLGRGAVVRVIAPASPFEAPPAWRGLGWLAERYRVRFSRALFERAGYLAGSDERRLGELQNALREPDVAAIVTARGGYGASRVAHRVDWSVLRARPRWIVGFSDATALHVEAARVGVASLHACQLVALGRGDACGRAAFVAALEQPLAWRAWEDLAVLAPGCADGTLFGGNLTLLHACAAAGRLLLPERCVLLIEDVSERPYRIDRMLTTLHAGGHLRSVTAVVAGAFEDCAPGPDGVSVPAVLAERLGLLGVPVVAGAPVGHGRTNLPAVLGAPARVEAEGETGRVVMGDR
ncbi:MAG: LD-carboxypeptidase [Deltaproteobacteria bacterium]|nr:LD-carboxypeptidase [Deltaproteobacteria bacterium]